MQINSEPSQYSSLGHAVVLEIKIVAQAPDRCFELHTSPAPSCAVVRASLGYSKFENREPIETK